MTVEIRNFSGEVIHTYEGESLQGANLKGTNLKGAELQGKNLQGANLEGSYLWGADLKGVELLGADLRETGITQEYLESAGASFDVNTKFNEPSDDICPMPDEEALRASAREKLTPGELKALGL